MKNLRLFALLLLLAPLAWAQETYSIAISNANNVTKLDLGRTQHNRDRCLTNGLPEGCTQAQVCVAASVAGGAACTVGDAIAAGQRVYPNSLAGREAFVANELVRAKLPEYVQKQAEIALAGARTFCLSANQTQKDAVCTALGLSAGCGFCDYFQ